MHTFEIRFARSTGLAAFFEVPGNVFRWKGAGKLIIDPQGIRIAVQRGLSNWFTTDSRNINADHLTEVYREGDALRLEFTSGQSQPAVLPIWASDSGVAAEIVKLLPTQRTVELEHNTWVSRPYRLDRSWLVTCFLIAMLVVVVAGDLMSRDSPRTGVTLPEISMRAPDRSADAAAEIVAATPSASAAGESTSREFALPSSSDPDSPVVETELPMPLPDGAVPVERDDSKPAPPLPPTTAVPLPASDFVPQQQLDIFMAELNSLRGDYLYLRDRSGSITAAELEERWWRVTVRIHNTPGFEGMAHMSQRELELAISRAWRSHLANNFAPHDLELANSLERQLAELIRRP